MKNQFATILVLTMALFMCSCESSRLPENYLEDIGFKFEAPYQLISQSSEPTIGDYIARFELRISSKDYDQIRNRITSHPNFQVYQDNELVRSAYTSGLIHEADTSAYLHKSTYNFEIYQVKNRHPVHYHLQLKKDSILKFEMVDF